MLQFEVWFEYKIFFQVKLLNNVLLEKKIYGIRPFFFAK